MNIITADAIVKLVCMDINNVISVMYSCLHVNAVEWNKYNILYCSEHG